MKIREPHREVERRERQNYLNPFPIKVLASTQHHYALVALPKGCQRDLPEEHPLIDLDLTP